LPTAGSLTSAQDTVTCGDEAARHESDRTAHDGGRNAKFENAEPRGVHVNMEPDCQPGDSSE
jgi:hypothetical protein